MTITKTTVKRTSNLEEDLMIEGLMISMVGHVQILLNKKSQKYYWKLGDAKYTTEYDTVLGVIDKVSRVYEDALSLQRKMEKVGFEKIEELRNKYVPQLNEGGNN